VLRYGDGGALLDAAGNAVGCCDRGVVRFSISSPDESIAHYREIGGAHFFERSTVPFAMSSLDTPVFHRFVARLRPGPGEVLVDLGGGDGRNLAPWFEREQPRIVILDAAGEALYRCRERIAAQTPERLANVVFVEADARALPLADSCAGAIAAIEVLYYLNEAYEAGLSECRRVLRPGGTLLLAERDYEAGLLTSLMDSGIGGLLRSAEAHSIWDGAGGVVRTRSFTEAELREMLARLQFHIESTGGISLLSFICGWLQRKDRLEPAKAGELARVRELLQNLGDGGRLRRCHVVTATR
jgi:ubiquinone/menaquinone biosynthesis C-methylase UbiE